MDTLELAALKANAFTLSKILKRHHAKLSSQQCLDVLSRLVANKPFEALLASKTSRHVEPDGAQEMTDISTLKAKAAAFSRILGNHNVKLSTRLCLDVLASLVAEAPFDALLMRKSGNAAAVVAPTALVDGVADAAPHSPVDTLEFMMPLSRPSTPWKEGAVIFLGADGKLQKYDRSKTMTVTNIQAGTLSMELAGQELAMRRASEMTSDTAKKTVLPDLAVPKEGFR